MIGHTIIWKDINNKFSIHTQKIMQNGEYAGEKSPDIHQNAAPHLTSGSDLDNIMQTS